MTEPMKEANVRIVRLGHGANCSSIGSVVDTLFVAAAVSGVALAVILAAMKEEEVTIVGEEEDEAE